MQRGMALGEAIETYSLLTVGDGLVSQIPALLLSVATGLIVTRVGHRGRHGHRRASPSSAASSSRCGSPAAPRSRCASSPACRSCRSSSSAALFLLMAVAHDRGRPSRRRGRGRGRRGASSSPRRTPPRRSPRRCGSTRSSSSSPPTSSTSSTPPAAATCSTGSGRCAARSPWRSAWSSRWCAPATTSTCPRRRTSSGSTASPAARAPRRPAPCWPSATTSTALPGKTDPRAGVRPGRQVGARSSCSGQAELAGATVVDRVVGHHHAPRRGRPPERRRLLGREDVQPARRDGQAHATRSWSRS